MWLLVPPLSFESDAVVPPEPRVNAQLKRIEQNSDMGNHLAGDPVRLASPHRRTARRSNTGQGTALVANGELEATRAPGPDFYTMPFPRGRSAPQSHTPWPGPPP
jgi:hypothetical protein